MLDSLTITLMLAAAVLPSTWPSLLKSGDRRLLRAAAGAGLTVAGYSVVDAYGARLSGDWASYTAWLIVLDSGSFFLLCWAIQGAGIWSQLDRQRWRTLISGVLGLGSFAVFLWALSR